MLTLPCIWVITPTPRQPGFPSPIALDDEQTPPSARSSPSHFMIYKPTISDTAKARRYLEKKSLPTIPITSQRASVIAAFARRLGNAIGFRRELVQSTHRHNHARGTPDVDERAELHSQPSLRIQTSSFDAVTNGHFTTTKQAPGHQPDHGMVASSASETIPGGEARQFSSYPNRAPRTELSIWRTWRPIL